MKTIAIILYSTFLFFSFTSESRSQGEPIQLSLFNPIQIVPEHQSVSGFRFNLIYGKNANVTGLDLGLVNYSTGHQSGLQFGGVSLVDGGFLGAQLGMVGITKGNFQGFQWNAVNVHQAHFNGLQLAIVNYAATLKGLQIGLINIIGEGGFLPVFPIFNFDFD
jgi:uncharacterized protein YjbI with pentapeptide repeats